MRDFRLVLIIIVVAILISIIVSIVKKIAKKINPSSSKASTSPTKRPYIAANYVKDGFLADGKCGWLDIECEDGETNTVVLNFKNKTPTIYIPLKVAKYRITYRAKSKAGMVASSVLKSINESNGAMGAFANAVYDAGELNGQLSTVVVDVTENFVLNLECTTDGLQKNCRII